MANKTYPLILDSRVYDILKDVAAAKGITMKQVIRSALALYIADNIMSLSITSKEEKKTTTE